MARTNADAVMVVGDTDSALGEGRRMAKLSAIPELLMYCNPHTDIAIIDVINERIRQTAKWGRQSHDWYKWITILGEEYGEACRESFEWEHIKDESALTRFRKELIEVAAVAVAIVEDIDRNGHRHHAT